MKRSACLSLGPYDSRTHCLFCGTVTRKRDPKQKSDEKIIHVKTDAFVQTVSVHCKTRGDKRANVIQSQIKYFGGDLHVADCVYHKLCSVNFCRMRNIPRQFMSAEKVEDQRTASRMRHSSVCIPRGKR